MSISDQAVSSKPVIFDRKIVLGQNTIHKDCISNNKVRFSAESKFPLASILCCHVWGLTVVWYMYVLSTIIIKLIFNKLSYIVGLISSLLQFRDILQFSYSPGIVAQQSKTDGSVKFKSNVTTQHDWFVIQNILGQSEDTSKSFKIKAYNLYVVEYFNGTTLFYQWRSSFEPIVPPI